MVMSGIQLKLRACRVRCRFQVRGVPAVSCGRCVRVGGRRRRQGRRVVSGRAPAPHPAPRHFRRHGELALSLKLCSHNTTDYTVGLINRLLNRLYRVNGVSLGTSQRHRYMGRADMLV